LTGKPDCQQQTHQPPESARIQQEKHKLYQAALKAWQNGEVSSALTIMGAVLDLDRDVPDRSHPEHTGLYQSLYSEIRTEHDATNRARDEARKHLAEHNYSRALALCEEFLAKHRGSAPLQALKFQIELQQRQQLPTTIASVPAGDSEPEDDRTAEQPGVKAARLPPEAAEAHEPRAAERWSDLQRKVTRSFQEDWRFFAASGALVIAVFVAVVVVVTRRSPVKTSSVPRVIPPGHIDTLPLVNLTDLLGSLFPQDDGLAKAAAALRDTARHATKVAPVSVAPPVNDHSALIQNLQNSAVAAYGNKHYAEPANGSAIYYSNQMLASDPNNAWAQRMIADSVQGVRYLISQDIDKKDFAGARRELGALAQLLPQEKDLKSIETNIDFAEKEAAPRPKPAPPPVLFSADVTRLHGNKSYSTGILSVVGSQLDYTGKLISGGGADTFTAPCSGIDSITEHKRLFSRHERYELHTASHEALSFVPKDDSAFNFAKLNTVCTKLIRSAR
jgi:hypothetical protein